MIDLHLYQTVHLRRGRARCVELHATVLRDAARTLFGIDYAPDPAQLTRRLEALATAQHYPDTVSSFVRIELTPGGEERLLPGGSSYYDGYALRSMTPDAVSVVYDLPVSDAPTTAREAAALLARYAAERAGAKAAVRCGSDGVFYSAEEAPLLGVCGHRVRLSPAAASVERSLAVRAVQAAGLELCEEPFGRAELPQTDELFWVDHRGVTALARCDGMPLMSLVAERVARAMEGLFSKK